MVETLFTGNRCVCYIMFSWWYYLNFFKSVLYLLIAWSLVCLPHSSVAMKICRAGLKWLKSSQENMTLACCRKNHNVVRRRTWLMIWDGNCRLLSMMPSPVVAGIVQQNVQNGRTLILLRLWCYTNHELITYVHLFTSFFGIFGDKLSVGKVAGNTSVLGPFNTHWL